MLQLQFALRFRCKLVERENSKNGNEKGNQGSREKGRKKGREEEIAGHPTKGNTRGGRIERPPQCLWGAFAKEAS
jgi:hypothetical protein